MTKNNREMFRNYIMQIGNMVDSNVQRIRRTGLLYGHLGAVIFLYHYARYSNLSVYEDNAEKIFENFMDKYMTRLGRPFMDGLWGVGWMVKYMGRNKFMNLSKDALVDYDKISIMDYSRVEFENEMDSEISLFSRGIYCSDMLIEKSVIKSLSILDHLITPNGESIKFSMCFLNSVTYFLAHCKQDCRFMRHANELLLEIPKAYKKCILSKEYNSQDLYILSCFCKKKLVNIEIPKCKFDRIRDIYINWQSIIYADLVEIGELPTENELKNYIDNINENINPDVISLIGLSSLGINLIIGTTKSPLLNRLEGSVAV